MLRGIFTWHPSKQKNFLSAKLFRQEGDRERENETRRDETDVVVVVVVVKKRPHKSEEKVA